MEEMSHLEFARRDIRFEEACTDLHLKLSVHSHMLIRLIHNNE